MNRDLVAQLPIDRWLIPRVPGCFDLPAQSTRCRCEEADVEIPRSQLDKWLDGLDAVMFVETPVFPELCLAARARGIAVICVPNWEWLSPEMDWLSEVDLMLCPTRFTSSLLSRWKEQFRFTWAVEYQPWPLDVDRFPFRRRHFCRRFVFVDGSGGVSATLNDGDSTVVRRKGLATVLAAARLAPKVSVLIYGPRAGDLGDPKNVEYRSAPPENRHLYSDGDVCIQPSHWEGFGLPLVECQAAGMPLVTTAAPPMNEHRPLAEIPTSLVPATLGDGLWIQAASINPDDVARVMWDLHGRWISLHSGCARRFVLREHNWRKSRGAILSQIAQTIRATSKP